jgi:hypothetical protein
MADGISVDFSEIETLASSLGRVPVATTPYLVAALEVAAGKIKDSWRQKLAGSEYFPALPYAVSYDIGSAHRMFGLGGSNLMAEIGFDKSRTQGPLGTISEFGTPRTPGRGYGLAALQENQADFEHGVDRAIEDGLREAGL